MNQFEIAGLCLLVPLVFAMGYALGNARGHREHVRYFEEEVKDESQRSP